jgi:hypothetical protein
LRISDFGLRIADFELRIENNKTSKGRQKSNIVGLLSTRAECSSSSPAFSFINAVGQVGNLSDPSDPSDLSDLSRSPGGLRIRPPAQMETFRELATRPTGGPKSTLASTM